jgi:hypothetical protein
MWLFYIVRDLIVPINFWKENYEKFQNLSKFLHGKSYHSKIVMASLRKSYCWEIMTKVKYNKMSFVFKENILIKRI